MYHKGKMSSPDNHFDLQKKVVQLNQDIFDSTRKLDSLKESRESCMKALFSENLPSYQLDMKHITIRNIVTSSFYKIQPDHLENQMSVVHCEFHPMTNKWFSSIEYNGDIKKVDITSDVLSKVALSLDEIIDLTKLYKDIKIVKIY